MTPADLAKYIKAVQNVAALLKANNVTLAQATAIAQGLEPILTEVGVTVPAWTNEVLGLLALVEHP